jgi:hypothetical protein
MYQEPPESLEQQSDQAILPNLNAQWVNAKGEFARIPPPIIPTSTGIMLHDAPPWVLLRWS